MDPSHCTLEVQDNVVTVIDHNSKSGTYVNGSKIPENKTVILNANDELKIGELVVSIESMSPVDSPSEGGSAGGVGDLELDLGGDLGIELDIGGEATAAAAAADIPEVDTPSAPGELSLGDGGDALSLDLDGSATESAPVETDAPGELSLGDEAGDEFSLDATEAIVEEGPSDEAPVLDLTGDGDDLSLGGGEVAEEDEAPVLDLTGDGDDLSLGGGEAPEEDEAPVLDLTGDSDELSLGGDDTLDDLSLGGDDTVEDLSLGGEPEENPELSLGGEDPAPDLSLGEEEPSEEMSAIEAASQVDEVDNTPPAPSAPADEDQEIIGETELEAPDDDVEIDIEDSFEDFQDEEEEEEEKVSFFAKIKNLFKRKPKEEDEGTQDIPVIKSGSMGKSADQAAKKRKKKIKLSADASSPAVRVLGIACDLVIVATIFQMFHRNPDFYKTMDDLAEMIKGAYNTEVAGLIDQLFAMKEVKDYAFLKEYFEMSLKVVGEYRTHILVYVLIRLFSTFLLGVSLGQFVMGSRGYGSILWIRIGGIFREILGLILLPFFLILDLPCVIGKRTFKEVITLTGVVSPSMGLFWMGLIAGLPFLIICYLASPLFENFETPKQYAVQKLKMKVIEGKEESEYIGSKMFNLSYFRPADVIFYPTLAKTIGKKSKKKVLPAIRFVKKGAFSCELKPYKRFDMFKLLRKAKGLNLLFKDTFPLLNKLIDRGEGYALKMSRADYLKTSTEFERLIKVSFELGMSNIAEHIVAYGPILAGYAKFKELFYNVLSAGMQIKKIQMKNINNSRYLFVDLGKGIESYETLIVPMNFVSGYVYKLSLGRKKAEQQIKAISESVLDRIIWKFDEQTDMSVLRSIDDLFDIETDPQLIRDVNATIYKYMFNLGREYIETANKGMLTTLKRDIKKTISIYEKLSARDKEFTKLEFSGYDNIIQNLNELLQALHAKDTSFFEMSEVLES